MVESVSTFLGFMHINVIDPIIRIQIAVFSSSYKSIDSLFLWHMSGEKWKKAMILTAFLFPCIGFAISSILDIIAMFYGSLAPIPSNIMVVALAIWAFISLPLVVVGTLVGRNFGGAPNDPCRTNTIPRPIPEKRFYLTRSVICLMGGVLPFGSIFVEIYFVFTCLWNYKVMLFTYLMINTWHNN